MYLNKLDVKIKDRPYDLDAPKNQKKTIHYKRLDKRILYKVYIYLSGRDVSFVRSVTYTLHKTFRNRTRIVNKTDSNPYCRLIIWVWGTFEIQAVVEDARGIQHEICHNLTFDKYFDATTFSSKEFEVLEVQ